MGTVVVSTGRLVFSRIFKYFVVNWNKGDDDDDDNIIIIIIIVIIKIIIIIIIIIIISERLIINDLRDQ